MRAPTSYRRAPLQRARQLRQVAWLDHLLERFQHDWETNPRYRASATGVLGLLLVLTFCACTGSGTLALNAGLTRLGLGGIAGASGGDSSDTGTSNLKANNTFPTPTLPAQTPAAAPGVSPIPNSQTPVPSATVPSSSTPDATATPTSDAQATNTPNPNQPPPTCNGGSSGATWAISPCPLVHGQGGSLTIVDHAHPGATLNIVFSFGACSSGANCTVLFTPGNYALDGSGSVTIPLSVPVQAIPGGAPVSGMINIGGGPTVSIAATAVA